MNGAKEETRELEGEEKVYSFAPFTARPTVPRSPHDQWRGKEDCWQSKPSAVLRLLIYSFHDPVIMDLI